jgi:hypothetical protein
MVQAVAQAGSECHYLGLYVSAKDAEKLLSRQHAAVVRLVKRLRADANAKKCRSGDELNIQLGRRYACDDLLAALQGGGAA